LAQLQHDHIQQQQHHQLQLRQQQQNFQLQQQQQQQHLQLQQQHQQQQLQQQLDQAATGGSVGGGTIPKVAGLRDTSINRPISKYVVQQHSVSNSFMDDSIDSIMGPMSSTKIDGGGHPISPAHNRRVEQEYGRRRRRKQEFHGNMEGVVRSFDRPVAATLTPINATCSNATRRPDPRTQCHMPKIDIFCG